MTRPTRIFVWAGRRGDAQYWANELDITVDAFWYRVKKHFPDRPEKLFKGLEEEKVTIMGRPRKSQAAKKLSGTLERRDKVPSVQINLPDGAPLPPAYLSPVAREAWGYVAGQLGEMGILTSADGVLIEMMCLTYARLREAQRTIDASGGHLTYTSNTPTGGTKISAVPEVAIVDTCTKTLTLLMSKCGMTPLDRMRLTMPDKTTEDNPFAEL